MPAEYVTHLHETRKSPATIAQAVAAVKWHAKNAGINRVNNEGDRVSDVVGVLTERTLAGIRRAGKERGQVDGLLWKDVTRVCAHADAFKTLVVLCNSAMIQLMSNLHARDRRGRWGGREGRF